MELGRLIGPELKELLQTDPSSLSELTEELHPQDVSECLEGLEDQSVARALVALPVEMAFSFICVLEIHSFFCLSI